MHIKDNALVHLKQAPCPQARYILGASTNKEHPANTYTMPRAIHLWPNKKLAFAYNYLNLLYRINGDENDTLFFTYNAGGTFQNNWLVATNEQSKTKIWFWNVGTVNNCLLATSQNVYVPYYFLNLNVLIKQNSF